MLSADPQPALIVFLRLPVWGRVKTRLASSLGDDAALRIYQFLSSSTLRLAQGMDCPVYLYYDPEPPSPEERMSGMQYRTQVPGDLGMKMEAAFRDVLVRHPSAMLIGSDCPYLTPDILTEGFSRLQDHDVVIGPAEDGGYYLLGCHAVHPFLFQNLPWGTGTIFKDTSVRLRQEGLRYHVLPTLFDIDTAADWNRFTVRRTAMADYLRP